MTTRLRLAGDPQAPDLTQLLRHAAAALRSNAAISAALADVLDAFEAAPPVEVPVADESPLRLNEAAAVLRLPYKKVRELVHSGQLSAEKPGRWYLIPRAEIRRYLASADRRAS